MLKILKIIKTWKPADIIGIYSIKYSGYQWLSKDIKIFRYGLDVFLLATSSWWLETF